MSTVALDSARGIAEILGMHNVKRRLETTVLVPISLSQRGEPTVTAPRGVLIYGAPGCGCSFVASKLAEELELTFGMASWIADDLDESKLAELQFVTDEAERKGARHFVIAVSHSPWDLDSDALSEVGIDRMTYVSPPDWDARSFRVWQQLAKSSIERDVIDVMVEATQGWTGRDIAAYFGLRNDADSDEAGSDEAQVPPVPSGPLTIVPSTPAWLNNARELLSTYRHKGMVDDLEAYLLRERLI